MTKNVVIENSEIRQVYLKVTYNLFKPLMISNGVIIIFLLDMVKPKYLKALFSDTSFIHSQVELQFFHIESGFCGCMAIRRRDKTFN